MINKIHGHTGLLLFLSFLPVTVALGNMDNFPPVFPLPLQAEYAEGFFELSEKTLVLLPPEATEQDLYLAGMLVSELAERYDLVLGIHEVEEVSGLKNFILMGSVANPLVRNYAAENNIPVGARDPGPEGYLLKVSADAAVVMGSNDGGAFYGLQSLRQLINRENARRIGLSTIKDRPHMPFRGIHMYLPGPENIAFFKRFVRDFLAYFKFNRIILEVNAVMRFDRHPELNAGWIELHKDMIYTQRISPRGPNDEHQDSVHDNAGDGKTLDKEQVAELVDYARQFHIEVIPEIPSLTHSYYLLTRHRELAEINRAEWPDTYCPLHPGSYELYFDVLDEYIEVIKPRILAIGHDEWRIPINVCERCRGKDYTELFIKDVRKIHDYLASKNIRTAMWGDHFAESHEGKAPHKRILRETGYSYYQPGALKPEQVQRGIPKDILILNWSWNFKHKQDNVKNFHDWGFEQVLGNFQTHFTGYEDNPRRSWEQRSRLRGVLGAEVSPWRTFDEEHYRTRIFRMVSGANHLWSVHYPNPETDNRIIQDRMPEIRAYWKGQKPPSMEGIPVRPLDIRASFNAGPEDNPHSIDLGLLESGTKTMGNIIFELPGPCTGSPQLCAAVVRNAGSTGSRASLSESIPVGLDVSSLVFLHTCAYRSDQDDLLGWYRVIYEDGFETLVPLLYGVNIREWHVWGNHPETGKPDPCLTDLPDTGDGALCYEADLVNCSGNKGKEMNFYAYEWRNPRFGIKIREIRLEGSGYRTRSEKLSTVRDGKLIENNAVALIALSCTTKRDITSSSAKSAAE
jgi:hypothetical protein